jgi:hypothetical protein
MRLTSSADAQKGTPFAGDLSQETTVLQRTSDYSMKLTTLKSRLADYKSLEPLANRVHGPRDLNVTTSSAAVVDLVGDTMATFVDDGLPTRTSTTRPLHEEAIPTSEITSPMEASSFTPSFNHVGWRGRGPPRESRHMGGNKPYADGGGLCSPGRWAPSQRRLPQGPAVAIRNLIAIKYEECISKVTGGTDDGLGFMFKLAAGAVKTCPFPEHELNELRAGLRDILGMNECEDQVATGQVLHLDLIARVLKSCDDPDWELFPIEMLWMR